jgi:transcriptional regulator with XRE-family HTH domain
MVAVVKVERLNELMYRKGWTRRRLAVEAQIGEVTAQQICAGKRNPSPPVAKRIVDALDVDFGEVFEIVNQKRASQVAVAK